MSGFGETVRALSDDGDGRWIPGVVLGIALMVAWGLWLVLGRTSLAVASSDARLEVASAARPVESEVEGRLQTSHVTLGDHVEAGQVLYELDATQQRLSLDEARAEVASTRATLSVVERLAAGEEALLSPMAQAAAQGIEQAKARVEAAEAASALAATRARRLAQLQAQSGISDLELLELRTEAQKQGASARAEGAARQSLVADATLRLGQQRLKVQELARERAQLEGQLHEAEARMERIASELGKRTLRAPISGRVGEVAPLREGQLVLAHRRLATIVPEGRLGVIAQFSAQAGLGRIRSGQTATLKLAAFPWTRFGSVRGTVSRVAEEPSGDLLRVEIEVDRLPAGVPAQHGLVGTVEVSVERVSPLELLLSAAVPTPALPAARADEEAP